MCEPATIALIATAAATATTAYGQYQSGQYQSKVAKNNAVIQGRMAADAQRRGENAENQHRIKVAQLKAKQRAAMSAKGLDISSGTPSMILQDTAEMGEMDALTIRSNAERNVYAHRVGATQALNQSKLASYEGTMGAAGTVLSGTGKVAGSWYEQNKKPDGKRKTTSSASSEIYQEWT